MAPVEQLVRCVSQWHGIEAYPHRYGGHEFRMGAAEVGHVHEDGTVDIPFARTVRDLLIVDGLATKHQWVPDSGWVTFRMRSAEQLRHALWLMRLSWIRYAIKSTEDPESFLAQESKTLQLSAALNSALSKFMATRSRAGHPIGR